MLPILESYLMNNKSTVQTTLLLLLSLFVLGFTISSHKISSLMASSYHLTELSFFNDTQLNVPAAPSWQNTYHYGIKDGGQDADITHNSNYPALSQNTDRN